MKVIKKQYAKQSEEQKKQYAKLTQLYKIQLKQTQFFIRLNIEK